MNNLTSDTYDLPAAHQLFDTAVTMAAQSGTGDNNMWLVHEAAHSDLEGFQVDKAVWTNVQYDDALPDVRRVEITSWRSTVPNIEGEQAQILWAIGEMAMLVNLWQQKNGTMNVSIASSEQLIGRNREDPLVIAAALATGKFILDGIHAATVQRLDHANRS